MGASFLITLREGLEISLVLAILIAYLVKSGRSSEQRSVWLGSGVAAIMCLSLGLAFHIVAGGLNGHVEQAVEGVLATLACGVLTWMVFWMRRNARSLGGELRAKVDAATTTRALVLIAFVAVLREGLETVLFLLSAETASSSGSEVLIGGIMGLIVAAVLGYVVYAGGNRLNLRTFFNITGILLILFAAGLAGKAVHEFRELIEWESGWLILSPWTISSGPVASGWVHDFLKALFGWSPSPERLRVVAYFGYLIPVLWLYLRGSTSARGNAPTQGELSDNSKTNNTAVNA
jgi:high-affinity iron transporter